jgi:hypothetical protein
MDGLFRLAATSGTNVSRLVYVIAAIYVAHVGTARVLAATITYTLDLSVPNAFSLTAATTADNGGIDRYSIPLVGSVSTVDHRTPYAVAAGDLQSAGFSRLRSDDVLSGAVDPTIVAGQSGTTPHTIYNFGQEPSNFIAEGITPIGFPDPTSDAAWTVPLLIARGTYDSTSGSLSFRNSVTLLGSVYTAEGSTETMTATIETIVIPPVPEPASASLLALCALIAAQTILARGLRRRG